MQGPNKIVDYFLRIALIVVLSMTMVNTSRANTYTVLMSGVQVAAADCDGFVNAYDHVFPTPEAVLSAFAATFPRTCYKSGVLHYTQNANNFVLTSNTSLTFDVLAIPANEYQGGTPAVYGILKTWTENVSVAECPAAGTSAGSFYVHTGDFPNSIYLGLSGVQYCADGCKVSSVIEITGSGSGGTSYPAIWKLVNGVKQFYAYRSYSHDGETCTAGAGLYAQPAAATVPATDTCAPGQSIIQMGAQVRCLNPSTGEISQANSASAVAAAETLAAQKRAAEIAAAQAAAGAAGLDAAGVQTAGAVAAGAGAVYSGSPGAASTGDEVMDSFCAQNPGVDICKQGTKQAQAGGALPDLGSGSWYEKTYPQGVGGVLTDNFNTMKNSPLLGLLNNIVPTLSGTAHNGCFSIEVWNVGTQSLCIPPFVLDALGLFMILTALFAARSIIFGG